MSIGTSGRVVVEIEPLLKRQLYASLLSQGLSLKEWFVINADHFIKKNKETSGKKKTHGNKLQDEK